MLALGLQEVSKQHSNQERTRRSWSDWDPRAYLRHEGGDASHDLDVQYKLLRVDALAHRLRESLETGAPRPSEWRAARLRGSAARPAAHQVSPLMSTLRQCCQGGLQLV